MRPFLDVVVTLAIRILGPAALFLALLGLSGSASADEPGDVRGCMVTYNSGTGGFLFEPFLKVADKSSESESGEPEVWGFRPWNLEPPDENGITHPVNIPDHRWIPLGVAKEVHAGTRARKIRCPDGLW